MSFLTKTVGLIIIFSFDSRCFVFRVFLGWTWYDYMQPGWCQPVRPEFMENECEALPGVAYPGVRDNRSTINTKTGYDDDDDQYYLISAVPAKRNGDLHWCVSLWRDPDCRVPHCRILSPDKTEWWLISATLCRWRRCFVADQLWLWLETCESEISIRIKSPIESAARFKFESYLESNRRIVVYSFNVKVLLIAIWEFCYFVGEQKSLKLLLKIRQRKGSVFEVVR